MGLFVRLSKENNLHNENIQVRLQLNAGYNGDMYCT
jgi:hypothetical protein